MRLLVIRTSAMGDVALLTPVLRELSNGYPGVKVTLLTRRHFAPFFNGVHRLDLFHPDFAGRHEGVGGLFRLFSDITKEYDFDHVIDLHDVLRSWLLRFLFRLKGIPVTVIDKGKREKRLVISGKRKVQLKHAVERYREAFKKAGFSLSPSGGPWIIPSGRSLQRLSTLSLSDTVANIGVAPYARHELKRWPEENMIKLLSMISDQLRVRYFLFGGREEIDKLKLFQGMVPGSEMVAGNLDLEEEIALVSRLNLMIAMDSSNMHLAALAGTRVVSIWGGTDPLSGFGAWQQPSVHSLSISPEELPCRPCTVYGSGKCRRGDHACMKWLTPLSVFNKIEMLKLLQHHDWLKNNGI
jgi:ADP-heptose:LPS heptosyltransferase